MSIFQSSRKRKLRSKSIINQQHPLFIFIFPLFSYIYIYIYIYILKYLLIIYIHIYKPNEHLPKQQEKETQEQVDNQSTTSYNLPKLQKKMIIFYVYLSILDNRRPHGGRE